MKITNFSRLNSLEIHNSMLRLSSHFWWLTICKTGYYPFLRMNNSDVRVWIAPSIYHLLRNKIGNPRYATVILALLGATLQWRLNERDGVSNHRCLDCLLNRVVWRRSKKTSKLRVTGLCEGNSPVTSEFPAQSASNAENAPVWWRHHAFSPWMLVHFFILSSKCFCLI